MTKMCIIQVRQNLNQSSRPAGERRALFSTSFFFAPGGDEVIPTLVFSLRGLKTTEPSLSVTSAVAVPGPSSHRKGTYTI